MKKKSLLDTTLVYYYILLFLIYIPTNGENTHWIPRPAGYYVAMALPLLLLVLLIPKRKINYYKDITVSMGFLAILFVYCALTSFWSSITFETLWRSCQTFIPILVLALLIMNVKDSKSFFIKILKVNVGISMFLSIISILVKILGNTYWLKNEITVNYLSVAGITINQYLYKFDTYFRHSSITGNPNLFGWILFLGVASMLILYFSKNVTKLPFIVVLLIHIYCLYLSYSRTCILVCFIFLTLFYFAKSDVPFLNKKNITKNIAVGSIFVAIVAFFYLLNGSDTTISLSGRNDIWSIILGHFASHPFNGIGFNSTQELLISSGVDENVISGGAHSFYVGFLAETGMIGMILFLLFTVFSLSLLIKQNRGYTISLTNKTLINGATCLLISLLIHQSAEFLILRNNYFNYIWFILLFTTLKFKFDSYKKAHE